MRRKNIIFTFVCITALILQVGTFSNKLDSQNSVYNDNNLNLVKKPEIASSWNLPYIHVNANWSYTEGNYTWCNGNGTIDNPYVIENVTINANDIGSGIHIENSIDYFEIRNCTITRAPSPDGHAGIQFDYVNNGTIFNNNLTDNYVGIHISNSNNNTILENLLIYNRGQGIILDFNSKFNLIQDNTGIRNTYYGLLLNSQSNNNTILGNTFNNNTKSGYGSGIRLNAQSDDNLIYRNTLEYNNYGIKLKTASNNTKIHGNKIENNNIYGVYLQKEGWVCNNTLLYNNTFDNPLGINAYDNGTNTQWNLGTLGNYWHDYPGVDLNDDGIGDSPHNIAGFFSSQDNYPIWADGDNILPTITLISPAEGTIFGTIAPTFNISIYDLNLNLGWYTINETITTYSFSVSNGVNEISINETAWDALSEGYIIVRFFANDLIGNVNNLAVNITKELPEEILEDTTPPSIILNYPLEGAIFGAIAPTFNITIYDLSLNTGWFTIGIDSTKIFFSVLNGTNLIPLSQVVWDTLAEGSVIINFFANDTAGNTNSLMVTINKDLLPDLPSGGREIPFGNLYLLITGISIALLVMILRKKVKQK